MSALATFLAWILARHAALETLTELRILRRTPSGERGVWSGYFGPQHLETLIAQLEPVTEHPRARLPAKAHPRAGEANLYFSLQGVDPGILQARDDVPFGRLARAAQTTRDRDIAVYTLFVVDIDPVRPSNTSATSAEKAAALEVSDRVSAWFKERGVTAVSADSGNGAHLLIPLVPYRGERVAWAARAAQRLLKKLDGRFSTPLAKVDTSTFNPSRILKLYGSPAVKGEPTLERPHRLASINANQFPKDIDLFEHLKHELIRFIPIPTGITSPTVISPSDSPRPCLEERQGVRAPSVSPRPISGAVPGTRSPSNSPRPISGEGQGVRASSSPWRTAALEHLPLERVYGELLTGRTSASGWLECRDPASPTGDQNPSAGVADGSGEAERGTFHSFRTGESLSVFDFLIQQGRAANFRAACHLVAAWSGVELKDCAAPVVAASVPSSRTTVDYVTNIDSIADLFDALIAAILPLGPFFRSERELVFIRHGIGPVQVTERSLPGQLSSLVELRFMRHSADEDIFLRYDTLPAHLARAFVHDPRVKQRLPELILYCRSPLYDLEWCFIGTPGFHPSGVYYDGPSVVPTAPPFILPLPRAGEGWGEGIGAGSREGLSHLSRTLEGFHFKTDADRANFIGILLTALTMPHWGRGHPFLAINGNKPGVGKTTLARVLGVIAEGSEPATVSYVPDDAELEKQLATRLEVGDRVIIIDNAKTRKAIESQVLERCVTDSRPAFRRLGSNSSITRPQNDLLFVLTMNMVQLGPDLRRRALPVNLHIEDNVRGVRFALEDVVGYVQTHRLEIVAELAGMVERWLELGRPIPPNAARHSTGPLWAATMDGILRASGFEGFLSNFEASLHEYDPSWELLCDIAAAHRDQPSAHAAEWVVRLERSGHTERFRDRHGRERTARAKATVVGTLFSEYVNSEFPVGRDQVRLERKWPDGSEHKPAYQFITLA